MNTLPVTIGLSSSGEPFSMDLLSNRHVFISYSDEVLLRKYMSSLITQILEQHIINDISWAIAVDHYVLDETEKHLVDSGIFRKFIDRHDEIMANDSNSQFQHAIYREFIRRQRAKKRSNNMEFRFSPLFILMDDMINRITVGATKKSTREFLSWFTEGFTVNMHGIFISPSSVRYLLQQIFSYNESGNLIRNKQISTEKHNHTNSGATNLGMEIILSGEGLVFCRDLNKHELKKLYMPNMNQG